MKESFQNFEAPKFFNPENELKKVRRAPKEERRSKLTEFKEELMEQKEGIAAMQENLFSIVRANPDIKLEELKKEIAEMGAAIKLTPMQKNIAWSLAEDYVKKHEQVEKTWDKVKELSNPGMKLYRELFGFHPKGQVEVERGPMTLYFKCSDPEDYAMIYKGTFHENRHPTEEEIKSAERTAGCSLSSTKIGRLPGMITAENSLKITGAEDSRQTMIHEEQHAFYKFFAPQAALYNLRNYFKTSWEFAARKTPPETFIPSLKRNFELMRAPAEEIAKDEILATMKEADADPSRLMENLRVSRENRGLYDYLNEIRNLKIPKVIELIKKNKTEIAEPVYESAVKELAEQVFTRDYHELLRRSITAFDILVDRLGFSKEKAAAFLAQEPLDKWPKAVERLINAKIKK